MNFQSFFLQETPTSPYCSLEDVEQGERKPAEKEQSHQTDQQLEKRSHLIFCIDIINSNVDFS